MEQRTRFLGTFVPPDCAGGLAAVIVSGTGSIDMAGCEIAESRSHVTWGKRRQELLCCHRPEISIHRELGCLQRATHQARLFWSDARLYEV